MSGTTSYGPFRSSEMVEVEVIAGDTDSATGPSRIISEMADEMIGNFLTYNPPPNEKRN